MKILASMLRLLPVFAMGMAVPALAQSDAAGDRYELSVGAGAGVMPSYAGSDDYIVVPGAVLRGKVDNFAFFSRGSNLYVDLVREANGSTLDIEFGPMINYRGDRSGHIEDNRVKALGELDSAFEAGGWVGIAKTGVITSAYDNLSFRVSYIGDISGAHKSYLISPTIEYGTPLSKASYVGLSVSADYVGKGFGRYYYDIDTAGALASGLATYGDAGRKAGFSRVNFGLAGIQSLSGDLRKGWAVFALGGYARMLGRYKDSPIVRDAGSADQWLGGLGVAYTF